MQCQCSCFFSQTGSGWPFNFVWWFESWYIDDMKVLTACKKLENNHNYLVDFGLWHWCQLWAKQRDLVREVGCEDSSLTLTTWKPCLFHVSVLFSFHYDLYKLFVIAKSTVTKQNVILYIKTIILYDHYLTYKDITVCTSIGVVALLIPILFIQSGNFRIPALGC